MPPKTTISPSTRARVATGKLRSLVLYILWLLLLLHRDEFHYLSCQRNLISLECQIGRWWCKKNYAVAFYLSLHWSFFFWTTTILLPKYRRKLLFPASQIYLRQALSVDWKYFIMWHIEDSYFRKSFPFASYFLHQLTLLIKYPWENHFNSLVLLSLHLESLERAHWQRGENLFD